ncbi:MAG TPA: tRNA(Ile)(2)-agmatinylcytidine synthase [Nitrososphaerales archaeon]|nr:tRNA(Ile)(2)-agmatinylcytidine synthase [Nitrososphaerales archaeon]
MRCLVGIDDTDSARGYCTTYLAFRIAADLRAHLTVVPYPRLVRLNPNIPFKTRGNAAVCLQVEAPEPDAAFRALREKFEELADVDGGANSGLVFLEEPRIAPSFGPLYDRALAQVINPASVRALLKDRGVRCASLGNGMGLVGAAASLAFCESYDHSFELISYRRRESWGLKRVVDPSSVRDMDRRTFPHTFNNYDYQKNKVLIAPHGPDPVFAGVRGDSPSVVVDAFAQLRFEERLEGHMVYISNQHTDAHLKDPLDWKVFSSGWAEGRVNSVETGRGGHVYLELNSDGRARHCAFYEPTGDLRRAAKRLVPGDRVKLSGGVRRATTAHEKVLNVEKMEVLGMARSTERRTLAMGTYISSPRANRHLTKPLIRYGTETAGVASPKVPGWFEGPSKPMKALARSP